MPNHGKGGRKTIGADGAIRNAPIPIRTTPHVKQMLELAALANGRSLTSEIMSRLELSFAHDILAQWRPALAPARCDPAHGGNDE